MVERVLGGADMAVGAAAADVVWLWDAVTSVQQDLDNFVVITLSRQNNRGDVGGERAGRNATQESLQHGSHDNCAAGVVAVSVKAGYMQALLW